MSDAGYTLVEMLAALIIIGMAVGGLTQAVRVIGHAQALAMRSAAETRTLRSADEALAHLMTRQGPFTSGATFSFQGSTDSIAFPCADHTACRADLASTSTGANLTVGPGAGAIERSLPLGRRSLVFVYGGDAGATNDWPPSGSEQILRWIGVQEASPDPVAPIALATVWREEPPGCVFDPIAQACRTAQ